MSCFCLTLHIASSKAEGHFFVSWIIWCSYGWSTVSFDMLAKKESPLIGWWINRILTSTSDNGRVVLCCEGENFWPPKCAAGRGTSYLLYSTTCLVRRNIFAPGQDQKCRVWLMEVTPSHYCLQFFGTLVNVSCFYILGNCTAYRTAALVIDKNLALQAR